MRRGNLWFIDKGLLYTFKNMGTPDDWDENILKSASLISQEEMTAQLPNAQVAKLFIIPTIKTSTFTSAPTLGTVIALQGTPDQTPIDVWGRPRLNGMLQVFSNHANGICYNPKAFLKLIPEQVPAELGVLTFTGPYRVLYHLGKTTRNYYQGSKLQALLERLHPESLKPFTPSIKPNQVVALDFD